MDVKSFRIVPFSKVGDTYNVVMFTIYDRINVADLLVQKRLATYVNSRYNTWNVYIFSFLYIFITLFPKSRVNLLKVIRKLLNVNTKQNDET